MHLVGTANCSSEIEILEVLSKFATMPNVKATRSNLELSIEYSPKDTENDREEEETIAKIVDILETVDIHGISLVR